MNSFREDRLAATTLPPSTVWLLEKLADSKHKLASHKLPPHFLRSLEESALSWIHENHETAPIEPQSLRRLHALAQEGTVGDAGE